MYSQYSEDDMYLPLLPDKGRCLDIGAWNPKIFSNSLALIEKGWSAVLVEPSPGPLQDLIRHHASNPEVKIIAAAVGLCPGMIEMHITDDAVSTSDEENRKVWAEKGSYYGRCFVPAITLAQIIHQFGGFDFVSIDAEGTSVELAKVLLATEMFPKVICVEHDNRLVELLAAAHARGYRSVGSNSTNLILEHA